MDLDPTIAALTSLQGKRAAHDALLDQLSKSLMIRELWPESFDHGVAKVGGRAPVLRPHTGTITIRAGNGEVREFPAMEVPFALWPAQMQADFEAMPRWPRERLRKRIRS